MKLYSILLWLCCLLLLPVKSLLAQTTVDFDGVGFDPVTGDGYGYGKAFGVIESGDNPDELPLAAGFVFRINATGQYDFIVATAGEGYQGSNALFDSNFDVGGITQWSIKKNDNSTFQFKGIFLKDAGLGGSISGTVSAYKAGAKIGNSVAVNFNGTLNQSFATNPDFYDIDEVRIEGLDLNIYVDQFMAGPPYSTNVNAPAQVSSIVIEGSPNSSATTMNFLVTFDKPVTNVSADDFTLIGSGATGTVGTITALSTSVYRVTITGITGEGSIRLDLNGGTNIATVTGNITGSTSFSAGEPHAVGPCGIENFDQGEIDNASSFSNNGLTYQLTGNWKVRKYGTARGLSGSDFHLSGTGTGAMSLKVSTYAFKVGSFYLFLSSDLLGNTPTINGSVTVTGKLAGNQKFTQSISSGFNANFASNSGYTFIDLGANGSIAIDELEIQLGGSFQYVDMDNISLCAILNNPPVNSVVPTISGTDKVGNVLSATTGSWTDADGHTLSYTYQWYRADNAGGMNRVPISSATNATYTLTTNDAHKHIQVVVTANDGNVGTAQANSLYTAIQNSTPVNSVVPTISGTALVGNALITTNGTWSDVDGDGRTYTYQWYRADDMSGTNEVVIAGANSASYTTTTSDAHKYVKSRVTANDGNGGITQANSLYTAIQNSAPVNSVVPTISGTALSGNTLSTTNGTWSDPDGDSRTYTYQWYRADDAIGSNETVILGANTASYMLVPNDVNKYLRVGVTANDGYGGTKVANSTYVLVLNTAPVLSNLNGDAVIYTEGDAAISIDAGSNATVTDSDSPDFDGGNVRVAITANRVSADDVLSIRNQGTGAGQIGVSGSNVTYAGVIIGTWSGGIGVNDLVVSFNGNSSMAGAQALVRNLTYINTNTTDPSTSARTVTVTVNDGDGGTSTPANVNLQITAVNDPPTLTATALNPTFTEGTADVSLFNGTSISTIESGQAISNLTLTVANVPDGNNEILKIDGFDVPLVSGTKTTGTNGLTVELSVTGSFMTVQLSKVGGISPAIMQGIVNGITYRNTSANPNTANRVIMLSSIQDNGGVDITPLSIASTVSVVAVNDAPIVTTSGGNTTYTEGTAAVVDVALTVSDPDNTTLASATVAIMGNFQAGQDVLEFTNNGTTMGNITAAYNAGTGMLTLSSAGSTATLAQWQAALRTVKYDNSSQNPSTANRTISLKVHDGGLESVAATKTVYVIAVNDAPVNSVPGAQSVDQDATLVFNSANSNMISISDVDAGSSDVQVNLVATNGRMTLGSTSGLLFSVGNGTNDASLTFKGTIANINTALNGLVFTPTPGYNGPASLQIITDDLGNSGSGGAKTDTDYIAITVNSVSPKVISVSASTANGTYKIDDVIALTVTFDQTVMVNTVGGTPTLLLETGAIDRMSTYVSGSGSNTLTFSYTVQPGDISADLDYTSTAALSLNGATIENIHNDIAILTLPTVGGSNSIAGQRAIVIDGVVPTVAMVAVPTNGYYLLNQNLDFTIYFSEAVLVDAIGGTPRLSLTIGGQTAYADYLSGSGSPALVFRYTVAAGLEDHDGVAVGALSLNGGTITDAAGNNAVLTLNSVGNTTGVNVDSNPPVVPANFTATGQDAQISLAWEANMETDFEKYILYVKPDGGVKTYLTDIAKGTEYYTYSGLPNGASYEFFLIAIDQRGHQSGEALASAKTMGEQSISFAALANLTYGQQGVVLTASATSNLPVSFVSSDSNIAEVYQDNNDGGKWKVNAKKVGTVTITAAQGGNNVYLPAASVPQSLTIVPAMLTVTADAKTKVYGEVDPALTYMVKASDLRNGDAATVVSGRLTRAQGEAVGNHDITNVDLAADNYAINYVKSQLSITKAVLTVTADAKTKVYGGADPALTYTVKASDLRNGDAATVVSGSLTRAQGEAVGNYDITNVDLAASNYAINYVKSALSITKAVLTVTADAKTKVYGTNDPALTYIATGFKRSDSKSILIGGLTRVEGENVGSYAIQRGTLAAGDNYTISYTGANLMITKATLSGLSFVNKDVVYDGAVKSIQLNGTLPTGVTVVYQNNDKINAGSYDVKAIIAETANYFGTSFNATLLIRKAKQTISFMAPEVLARDAGKISLDVQSSSNLPVQLMVDDPMVATVSGTDLNVLRLGTVRITATQAGNENYEAAAPVNVSVRVANDASAKLPIIVHQAVSPNGDGINEFLIIEGIRDYIDNKVTIFDKNGVVLAEIQGYDNRDRVFFGKDHRDGTYYYYIDVKDGNTWKREKGFFVIKR
ncbi:MBG domain-containing protein [Sphingobacterium sp. xlx-130]|uniref:MBG domain-containing protein n=1 Tax=Sphingobacterium sp. xlx-130 TaxID=2654323 RepID=UPI0013DBB931|nr:MBG domain-containing protein [Sphingobacterium sp. xlx-130]